MLQLPVQLKIAGDASIQGTEATTPAAGSTAAILPAGTIATDSTGGLDGAGFEALIAALEQQLATTADVPAGSRLVIDESTIRQLAGTSAGDGGIPIPENLAAGKVGGGSGEPIALRLQVLPMLEGREGEQPAARLVIDRAVGMRLPATAGDTHIALPDVGNPSAAAGAQPTIQAPSPAAMPGEVPVPPAPARPPVEGAVTQRVRWMVDQGVETAELRLDPPRLGTLGVRVRVDGDQATLSFQSPHAPVREAVEAAVPRLRELLADAGLDLAGVDVGGGDTAPDGDAWAGEEGDRAGGTDPDTDDRRGTDRESTPGARVQSTGIGLVDRYA